MLVIGFLASLAGLALLLRALPDQREAPLFSLTFKSPEPLRYEWRLIDGKHWQIVAEPREAQAEVDRREGTRGACREGMVEVKGRMLVDPPGVGLIDDRSIEEKQKTTCKQWINREYPERCASFDRARWLELSRGFATQPMHFCMDRYEYPNEEGQYPVIFVNFDEAAELCAKQGKRLCDEAEWTFACEGEEATPYPYGYIRDPDACVIDRKWRAFNASAMHPRDGDSNRAELDRLWQGVPSGSQPHCRSPFGVYDLTGNVDEWTVSVRPGRRSILKGGYWGPVRTRCRPSTRSHDESHTFYQQGVRCCADPGDVAPSNETAVRTDPSDAPLPRELR
jgi:hypothetical protein